MKDLREKVDEFDKVRSNKEEITSLKIVEKLQSKSKSMHFKINISLYLIHRLTVFLKVIEILT